MDFIAKAKAAFGKVHLCILLLHLYPFCPFDALHPITYFLHFFTLSSKKENAKNLTDPEMYPPYWVSSKEGTFHILIILLLNLTIFCAKKKSSSTGRDRTGKVWGLNLCYNRK